MARELASVDGPFGIFAIDISLRDDHPGELYSYLLDLIGERPCLFFGSKTLFNDRNMDSVYQNSGALTNFLELPFQGSDLQAVVDNFINWYQKEFGEVALENPDEDLLSMRIRNFFYFKKVQFDVYVKVDEKKYVLAISRDKDYSQSLISDYSRRHVKFLHVRKNEFIEHLERSLANLSKALEKNKSKIPVYLKLQIRGIGFLHDYIRNIGITEEIQEYIDNFYQSSLDLYGDLKKVELILQEFPYDSEFIAEQAVMQLYLTEFICRKLGYISEFPRKKLGLSSIIHDAMLINEDLANIRYLSEEIKSKLTNEDLDDLNNHPEKAADASERFFNFTESDYIISQHHEFTWGADLGYSGFPQKANNRKISNLSAIFIIMNHFSTIMCEHKGDLANALRDMQTFMKQIKSRTYKESADHFFELFNNLKG
jgi:hypothetical protein